MTAQEAIKAIQIKEMQIECKATRMCEFCEGLVMAEEALEKQISLERIIERIVERIEEEILEKLSDGGDDWFEAELINNAIEIVKEEGGLHE